MVVLRYGDNSSVELTLAAGVIPSEVGVKRGEPLADLPAATVAALANPLDYPPLAQCIMPADRVVLAVDQGTPGLAQIAASVIQTLVDSGVEPESIGVLPNWSDREARGGSPCRLLAAPLRERITVLPHDPTDRRQLAYLAANEAGDAILINRFLHEADVVISIGCLRADETPGYFGIHGVIYPALSDSKTIQRFRSHESSNGHGHHGHDLITEANHVAWLLGVNFTIQVVPAAGGQALHVLAGQSESVERRGRELYRAAWSWPVSDRASLVVAGIEGGASQQTWENFGRTLQTAVRFVEEDGAIVICSDLAAHPGAGLRRAAHAHSPECGCSSRHAEHPRGGGAPAAQLGRVLQGHKVYLLSQLDPSIVEELDVIPIAKPDELNRLARQHGSCIVLSNAPYVTTNG